MNEEKIDEKSPEVLAGDPPPVKEERKGSPPTTEGADNTAAIPDTSFSEPPRNDPPPQDPRRRLRELLAIPDHQRTDAIWDEIIELEICLAPGNRIQGAPAEPGRRQGQGQGQGQGRRPDQQRRQDQIPGAKPAKRFFKKPKRPQGAPPKT
ncbi:MAG: hypothetical protein K9J74_01510 [Sulfuritalea sp.]|nr:hypothetical protein [Sulfuritalea sp.]